MKLNEKTPGAGTPRADKNSLVGTTAANYSPKSLKVKPNTKYIYHCIF